MGGGRDGALAGWTGGVWDADLGVYAYRIKANPRLDAATRPRSARLRWTHRRPGAYVQIHHVVLRRIDGSEVRRNFVAIAIDAPRVGSTVQLAISDDRDVLVSAKVTAVQTITFASRDGRPGTADVTVHALEIICVPVADNDP